MRIVAMAHQWLPEHCAGAEVMLHAMLQALAARGHRVDVLLSRQAGPAYVLDGVHLHPGGTFAEHRDQADVIVTHLENTPAACKLGRWHGIPTVTVLHNTMPVTRAWLAAEPPSLVVFNSQWMRADFARALAAAGRPMPERHLIVRPPVPVPRKRPRGPGDRLTLVNLRAMEESPGGGRMGKGGELFWELARRQPQRTFLGVRGAYGTQVEGDEPNVWVLDHQPHHMMATRVYARTRVLLAPSSYESWGMAAVEALSYGIPVIAHPTPGLVEALGPAGVFADRDDPEAWLAAIALLDDPAEYAAASSRALLRALALDPAADLAAWCSAVEALVSQES